jgi:hypothetical protein
MDTLLCNDDGDIVLGTYQPSNTLLSLSADQYTAGSATWSDQSGNGLDFTVSTNASLKGTDADGFPYMNFGGSYGIAKRIVSSALTNITAPTTGKYTIFCVTQMLGTTTQRTLIRGSSADHQVYVSNNTNNLGLYDNSGSNFVDSGFDITTAMANSRNLLVWELSTSSPIYKFQLNESGTDSTITSATNYTLPFCCIGGYHNVSTVITTSSQYWGNIYEFIVYDGVLSASERAYVAEYLTHKWDISSKLPSSFTSTHGVLTNEETLAFLYAGSGTETETTYTWDAEGVTYADILVVGGGGGGGEALNSYFPGGGGGGGEVVFRQGVPVTPGVEIKVGRGGPELTQGGISQFTSSIQANGGGSGNSGNGGSGGGAGRRVTTSGASVKLSVDGFGNEGGVSQDISTTRGGAGGGGAMEAGFTAFTNAGARGGEGYTANVFGIYNDVYGSGGGGGDRLSLGGLGGTNAGNGGNYELDNATSGVPHRGGGGGAGAGSDTMRGSGAPGGSGIVLVKPNPGALDGLGSSVYTQAVGAYALRRLFGAYTGPQIEIRRSLDDATSNVYFDKYGYPVNFNVETWLGGGTGYVVTWYDQSPASSNAAADTVGNQPVLTQFGGKWVVQFDGNTQNLRYSQIDVLSVWCRYYILSGTNNWSTLIGRAGGDRSLRQFGDNIASAGSVGDWIASGTGEWSLNTTIVNKTNARLYSPWVQWNTFTGNRSSSYYGILMNEMGRGSYSGQYRGLNGYMSELILYSTQGALTGKHTSLNQTV